MADSRELRETLGSAGNGAALRVIGSSRKYKEVTETGQVLTAIVNLAAANRELWPYDQVKTKILKRVDQKYPEKNSKSGRARPAPDR